MYARKQRLQLCVLCGVTRWGCRTILSILITVYLAFSTVRAIFIWRRDGAIGPPAVRGRVKDFKRNLVYWLALRNGIAMADFHCASEITERFLFNLWQRCYGHFCVLINDGKKFQRCRAFIVHLLIDKNKKIRWLSIANQLTRRRWETLKSFPRTGTWEEGQI